LAIQNESGADILIFERKSIPDLLASIKDGRYEEQSYRLIHASGLHPHNIVYVIEGALAQIRSPADKKIVLSAITSLSFFKGFSVIRTGSLQETAELVCSMATKIYKDFEKGKQLPNYVYPNREPVVAVAETQDLNYSSLVKKVKQANITPENIGEILLSQIPGVSGLTAREILKPHNGSFRLWLKTVETAPESLDTIYLSSAGGKRRKLGSNIIQNIRAFLLSSPVLIETGKEECCDSGSDKTVPP
jgi:ERCC4-type nuclease